MAVLAAGASITVAAPAGQTLTVLPGGQGTATMGPGFGAGQTYGCGDAGTEVLGPFDRDRVVYLSCSAGGLTYAVAAMATLAALCRRHGIDT